MKRLESLSRREGRAASSVSRLLAVSGDVSLRPVAVLISVSAALGLAGCASQPTHFGHGSEYFPTSVYGRASPRVIPVDDPVPHGGGVYKVGRPYTVAGHTYYPRNYKRYSGVGLASWYGDAFHGRRTANGEIYDANSISAAHLTMPLPSYARVTNLRNHYSIIVRVNDRGPFSRNRIMDVSRRVASLLDFRRSGTTLVRVDYIGPASLAGSDDTKLAATLRENGQLAQLDMRHPPTYEGADEQVETASADIPNEQVPQQVADLSTPATKVQASFTGHTPLPPARPFDLDTIPGADAQISAR
jgi:peptidoglycan lytic transglycosylase